jgi:gp16 family phage-associated protein
MPNPNKKSKLLPLPPKDIRRVFFENGDTIAGWAREQGFRPWQVHAVISGNPEVVYQEVREALADYVGCDVSQIGREPKLKRLPEEQPAQAVA